MATRQADSPLPWGEFELIDKLFAPLARSLPGAFDLKDDVAVLAPRQGHELVLKRPVVCLQVNAGAVASGWAN